MKHLENFKSEYIQGIYDFLEQDADVTNFKRDLIAISEFKEVELHDLEAQYFEYFDLMKQDLSDKIVFIFREDGYLGMFTQLKPLVFESDYLKLKTGDNVSLYIITARKKSKQVNAIIWREDNAIYAIQDYIEGRPPNRYGWKQYGRFGWVIYNHSIYDEHNNLLLGNIPENLDYLIIDSDRIKELKETMHFALVI